MADNTKKLISSRYGNLFQVSPEAVHGDRDFREHAKNRLNYYEKLLLRLHNKNEGMGATNFTPLQIMEADLKVKGLINHWATVLETLGGV